MSCSSDVNKGFSVCTLSQKKTLFFFATQIFFKYNVLLRKSLANFYLTTMILCYPQKTIQRFSLDSLMAEFKISRSYQKTAVFMRFVCKTKSIDSLHKDMFGLFLFLTIIKNVWYSVCYLAAGVQPFTKVRTCLIHVYYYYKQQYKFQNVYIKSSLAFLTLILAGS